MVIAVVLEPWTLRRPDDSIATPGERVVLPERRAQRLAEQGVVRIVEPIGG